jgi:hypothetical protein
VAIGSRSDRGERRGAELTGVARFSLICMSASSNPGDATLLGASGGDDEVRLGVASKMVVVVADWVVAACRGAAGGVDVCSAIGEDSDGLVAFWLRGSMEKREGWRGLCRRRGVGKGLGHGAASMHQTARGGAVFGPVFSKTMSDRWAPPVSVLSLRAAYPFGCGVFAGPGPLLGLGRLVPRSPFAIFC